MAIIWYDYVLFIGMLAVSVVIGIYFGFFGKKENNKDEYLLGGKTMHLLPVSISLIASMVSGLLLLTYPVDVYKYGSNLVWLCLTLPVTSLVHSYIFLPVFFNLQGVTSLYEYLHLRFSRKCRLFGSFIYTVTSIVYNTGVIYIPSIALAQATGFDIFYIALVLGTICIFYTTVGGLKAVVWTHAFQFLGMLLTIVGTLVTGFIRVGGFKTMWYTSLSGQRLDIIDFRFDLTLRNNFWVIIGATIHWMGFLTISQGIFQKCLAVRSLSNARCAILIYGVGVAVVIFAMVLTGNILYANYSTCDPLSTNQVQRHDQLLPYFVIQVASTVPGLLGIFMAGIFCASLSTFSSVLNTIAATTYEDFLSPLLSSEVKQNREALILKLLVVIAGIISTVFVLVVQQVDEMMPFIVALHGIVFGPMLGLFTLGVLFPIANSKGALIGGITALSFLLWIAFGNLLSNFKADSINSLKPMSVDGCNFSVNVTMEPEVTELPFMLYRISTWYYTVIGTVITIVIGIVISCITKKGSKPVDKELVNQNVQCF